MCVTEKAFDALVFLRRVKKVPLPLLDLCAYSRVDVNDSDDDELLATGCRYSGLLLGLFRVGVVVLE